MNKAETTLREPLVRLAKQDGVPMKKKIGIRAAAIVLALVIDAIFIVLVTKLNPIQVYVEMFKGTFETSLRFMWAMRDMVSLLCIGIALAPAFKMRFWNIGAEGQALVGGLACAAVMFFLGESLPLPLLLVVMIVASVVAGMIWAVLPAIFKAFWNTNETLFTLMMNYVATQLVAWFLKQYVESGSGVMDIMPQYGLPVIGEYKYLLNVLIVALLTLLVYIYLKYSKQGYEISVVGESENTARYIGINVKKVIIRTMLISGALCGVAGLLLVGGTNHTISTTTVGGRGFTAIMVSWLAKFNPLFMVLTTFLIIFLELGSKQLTSDFGISSSIADISTGIILLFIIGCEFFLQYRIVLNRNRKEATK